MQKTEKMTATDAQIACAIFVDCLNKANEAELKSPYAYSSFVKQKMHERGVEVSLTTLNLFFRELTISEA